VYQKEFLPFYFAVFPFASSFNSFCYFCHSLLFLLHTNLCSILFFHDAIFTEQQVLHLSVRTDAGMCQLLFHQTELFQNSKPAVPLLIKSTVHATRNPEKLLTTWQKKTASLWRLFILSDY
jgi:hypothetical protein